MTTEAEVIANQSAYIEPTQDQVKILRAKELMRSALFYIDPWGAGKETYADIQTFINDA